MTTLSFLLVAVLAQLGQIQLPAPVGYVNDFARVLAAENVARIDAIIQDVKKKSGGEIVVVTLPDLKGRAPVDVATQIGRQWKVGQQGGPGDRARNTGVIILLVPRETSTDGQGHAFIAPGTGSEGFITDATAGAIIDEALPALRQHDYGSAVELMTALVAERFAREFQFQLDSTVRPQIVEAPQQRGNGGIPPWVILLVIFIVLSMVNGGRRRGGCGGCMPIFIPMGGGGFRGGGGFGGGGFGGGFGGGGFGGFGGGGGFSGGGAGRGF